MGNTFKSLVAAAGILAAGDATNAQEGADSTANKTKQALVELLSELPPGFDSARKVIEWDITLAGDGDLSDSDKLAIEGHMWKLATVIPESARKVREAMTGVETIVAADQVAALNESPEERKARLEKERMQKMAQKSAETLNDEFLDDRNWKFDSNNSLEAKIKRNWRSIEIQGDTHTDVKREAKVDLATTLAPGNYNITVIMSAGWPLRLYLYDSTGKSIDMSGGVMPEGWGKSVAQFLSGIPTKISIPNNCRKCLFQGKITAQDNRIVIDDFSAQGIIEEGEFAKN